MHELADIRPALPDGLTVASITTGTALCLAEEVIDMFDEDGLLPQSALTDFDAYQSAIAHITEAMPSNVIVGSVGLLFVRAFGSYALDCEFDTLLWIAAKPMIEENISRTAEYAGVDEISARIAASEIINDLLLPVSMGTPLEDMPPSVRTQEDILYTHVGALIAATSVFGVGLRSRAKTKSALLELRAELYETAQTHRV